MMKAIELRNRFALRERVAERGEEMRAVEIAGELVVARQEGEALLALVALVDDPEHAMGERRPAALAGVPAADILDPQPPVRAAAAGVERVLHLVGDAVAAIRAGRVEHGVVPAGQIARIEERRKAASARDRLERSDLEDVEDVGTPADAYRRRSTTRRPPRRRRSGYRAHPVAIERVHDAWGRAGSAASDPSMARSTRFCPTIASADARITRRPVCRGVLRKARWPSAAIARVCGEKVSAFVNRALARGYVGPDACQS